MTIRVMATLICLALAWPWCVARAEEHAPPARKKKGLPTSGAAEGHGDAHGAAAGPAKEEKPAVTTHYVHEWLAMPTFAAPSLVTGDLRTISPARGRALVLIFLASWCEPCQQLMPALQELEKKFARLHTDFVYVFAHDTPADADAFFSELKLRNGVIASYDALKAYHNPELPAIYLGDRRGWLAGRYLNAKEADVAKLAGLLQYLTAY